MAKKRFEYEIEVLDKFAANLQRFRTDLETTRQVARTFRTDLQGLRKTTDNLNRANRNFGRSFSAFNKNTAKFKTQSKERRQSLRDETAAVLRLGRVLQQQADKKVNTFKNTRIEANKLIFELRLILKLIKQIQSSPLSVGKTVQQATKGVNSLAQAQGRLTSQTSSGTKANKTQGKSFEDLGTRMNRISFTFRRLFGILAAFTLARRGIEAIVGGIRSLITANIEIERSNLALSGIFAATTTSINGQTSTIGRYKEATKLAVEFQTQLRIAALRTSATFEELSRAAEVAIGPALREGFSPDEIIDFVTRISQAASAVGLAQNQLAEEVRSLLQGTITPRNTRIATILGITPADIRRARASGELVDFLRQRFEAFAIAGEKSLETFQTKLTNAIESLRLISAAGGTGFFNQLKSLFDLLRNSATTIDEKTRKITLNPKVVAAVKVLSDALAFSVSQIEELIKQLSVDKFSASLILISDLIKGTSSLIKELISGALLGFNDVAKVIRIIKTEIEKIFESLGLTDAEGKIKSIVSSIARIGAILLAITIVTSTLKGFLSLSKAALLFIPNILFTVIKSISRISSLLASLFILTGKGLGKIITSLLIINGKIFDITLKIILLGKRLLLGVIIPLLGLPALIVAFTAGLQSALKEVFNIRISAKGLFDVLISMLSRWVAIALSKIVIFWADLKEGTVKLGVFIFDVITKNVIVPIFNFISKRVNELGSGIRLANVFDLSFLNDIATTLENVKLGEAAASFNDRLQKAVKDVARSSEQQKDFAKRLVAAADIGLQETINKALKSSTETTNILEDISSAFKLAGEKLALIFNHFLEGFKINFDVNAGIVSNIVGGIVEKVKLGIANLKDLLASQEGLIAAITKAFSGKITTEARSDINEFLEELENRLSEITNGFQGKMETVVGIILNAIDQTADALSEILIDLFSGEKAVKIKEVVGRLFRSIGQEIAKELIKALIVSGVLKLLKLLTSNPSSSASLVTGFGPNVGEARGGKIPFKGRASLAHLFASGLSAGGALSRFGRPKGLDSRDTTPIWAQPGEFMVRKSSVDKYGISFLSALNAGLIDPTIAALGAHRSALKRFRSSVPMPVGRASGGEIPSFRPSPVSGVGGAQVVAAITVPDKKTMRALLKNGGSVLLDFLRENKVSLGS